MINVEAHAAHLDEDGKHNIINNTYDKYHVVLESISYTPVLALEHIKNTSFDWCRS